MMAPATAPDNMPEEVVMAAVLKTHLQSQLSNNVDLKEMPAQPWCQYSWQPALVFSIHVRMALSKGPHGAVACRVGANLIFLAVDDWWAGAKKGMLSSAQKNIVNKYLAN
jgi:hypothetical protein